MNDQQRRWLDQLSGCTFLPGSWDKRFVRDLAGTDRELTAKQAAAIERLAYKYRRQRRDPNMPKPKPVEVG